MRARTIVIMSVLLDLKQACIVLLRQKRKNPALLTIYCFIDICAALASHGKMKNRDTFESYLATFGRLPIKSLTTYDLWAARSSLLHTFSPLGHHTRASRGAQPIFYYAWPDKRKQVEDHLRSQGYDRFLLMRVEDVHSIAVWAFNSFHHRVESDPAFETRVLRNARDLLFDLHDIRLQEALSLGDVETLRRCDG